MSKIDWCNTFGWNEEHIEELRFAAYSYIRQGKYDIAVPIFEALNILDRESAYDAQTLGALYIELNQPEKAIPFLDKALKLDEDHSPTMLNMTKALFMLGKKNEALKLAKLLSKELSPSISNIAKALVLAYS